VRVTKDVVLPGRRNGGTTLVFSLKQRSAVRFTVVRVYPSCKRVGSFTVRARAGQNRVRFNGKLGGQALGEGVYRVLAQVRGHEKAVATVTLIVARGQRSAKNLRRSRPTACSQNDAQAIEAAIGAAEPPTATISGGQMRIASVANPVVGSVKGLSRTATRLGDAARAVPNRIADLAEEHGSRIVLTMVGMSLLLISLIGTLVLLNIVRIGYRYRVFR
jgi:hypothetical protein